MYDAAATCGKHENTKQVIVEKFTEEDQLEFLTPCRGVDVDVTDVDEEEACNDKDDLSAGVHAADGDFAEVPLYHGDIAVDDRADDEQDGGEEEHVLVAFRQLNLEQRMKPGV